MLKFFKESLFCCFLFYCLLSIFLYSWRGVKEVSDEIESSQNTLGDYRVEEYVGASTCAECHAEAHAKWEDSHHYHAMELLLVRKLSVQILTILNSLITELPQSFSWRVKNTWSKRIIRRVRWKFLRLLTHLAWEPLQQFLVKFPDGRMQVLPTLLGCREKEWYHLYPDEKISHDDPLFWTRSMQNWDHMCADCHSTNLRKEFNDAKQTFSTSYSEMNAACEPCHGPGRDHVEFARSGNGWAGLENLALVEGIVPMLPKLSLV